MLGLPNVKLQAEEKTFWQRCDICGCQARVPYAKCNFCGDQPSYHHGRCCFRNPGRPATEDTDRPLPTSVPQQDPQRHLWRGCPEDCEREGYVGICLPCEDFELAPEDAKPEARESRCDLRCQYFYEDGRQCELDCFLTLAHHSQLGYYHLCEQHYGCVTDDEDEERAVLWLESTLAHAVVTDEDLCCVPLCKWRQGYSMAYKGTQPLRRPWLRSSSTPTSSAMTACPSS